MPKQKLLSLGAKAGALAAIIGLAALLGGLGMKGIGYAVHENIAPAIKTIDDHTAKLATLEGQDSKQVQGIDELKKSTTEMMRMVGRIEGKVDTLIRLNAGATDDQQQHIAAKQD